MPLPFTSSHWFLCFGTRPRHQTRAPCLGPPRLMKAKSNFFTNRNILHTLKNEPLNIMLLHTSRRMECPLLLANGPSHGARVWCLCRVPKHRNHWQEVDGLLFSPQNSQLVHILSTSCQWFLCFGTQPRHQTRAPWLGPPRLKTMDGP